VIEERLGVLGVELEVDEGVGLGRAADRRELGGDHDIGALLMGRRLGVVLGAALAVEHRAGGLLGGHEDAAADLGVALEDVLHTLELTDAIEELLGAPVVFAGREDLHRLHVVDHGLLDLPFALVDLPEREPRLEAVLVHHQQLLEDRGRFRDLAAPQVALRGPELAPLGGVRLRSALFEVGQALMALGIIEAAGSRDLQIGQRFLEVLTAERGLGAREQLVVAHREQTRGRRDSKSLDRPQSSTQAGRLSLALRENLPPFFSG
jgi:hypothetical protein